MWKSHGGKQGRAGPDKGACGCCTPGPPPGTNVRPEAGATPMAAAKQGHPTLSQFGLRNNTWGALPLPHPPSTPTLPHGCSAGTCTSLSLPQGRNRWRWAPGSFPFMSHAFKAMLALGFLLPALTSTQTRSHAHVCAPHCSDFRLLFGAFHRQEGPCDSPLLMTLKFTPYVTNSERKRKDTPSFAFAPLPVPFCVRHVYS